MKLVFALLVVVFLVALCQATPTKKPAPARTTPSPKPKTCAKECPSDFKPICAGDGVGKNKSFGSACVLENHNCEQGTTLKKVSDGECPGGGGIRLS